MSTSVGCYGDIDANIDVDLNGENTDASKGHPRCADPVQRSSDGNTALGFARWIFENKVELGMRGEPHELKSVVKLRRVHGGCLGV